MPKPRKMLGSVDSPYIISLMHLIETQSKTTIAKWCIDYAEEHILSIYEKAYPNDNRLRDAINASNDWLDGKVKLPMVVRLLHMIVLVLMRRQRFMSKLHLRNVLKWKQHCVLLL